MGFTCEYCDRVFNRRFNLVYHQQHTKYCIKKQESQHTKLTQELEKIKLENEQLKQETTVGKDTFAMHLKAHRTLPKNRDEQSDREIKSPAAESEKSYTLTELQNLFDIFNQIQMANGKSTVSEDGHRIVLNVDGFSIT